MKKETRRKLETLGARIINFAGTTILFGGAAGLALAAIHPKTKVGYAFGFLAVSVAGGMMADAVFEKTDPIVIETMNGLFASVDGLEDLYKALFAKKEEAETEE